MVGESQQPGGARLVRILTSVQPSAPRPSFRVDEAWEATHKPAWTSNAAGPGDGGC